MNYTMNYSILSAFDQNSYLIGIVIALIIVSLSAITIAFFRMKLKTISNQLQLTNQVFNSLSIEQGIEKHLNHYLEIIMPFIVAGGYYFYIFDSKSGNYVLRVNRQSNSSPGKIAPSYSGLVPYSKEKYNPPLGLPRLNEVEGVALIRDGEVPVIQVLIKGGDGLIRIGPVRSLSLPVKTCLETISDRLQPALTMLLALEKQKNDAKLVVATGKAINGIAKSIFDVDSLISKMLILCAKMINADACSLIVYQGNEFKTLAVSGLKSEVETRLRNDRFGLQSIFSLIGTLEFRHLSPQTKDFDIVPPYLIESGFQSMSLIKVDCRNFKGVAVFWHYQVPVVEQHKMITAKNLLARLEDLFAQQSKYKELTSSYIGALKILVEATDNLEPSTVGHSDLIANNSVAIAKQLKLPEQDIRDIALAGYFHDIGMIGLSNDILFKPGKYSALEFETMKLHAEVGASIGESTIANSNASLYIRHHHERWDGYGYPQGLRGEEIPLGARIIAVADMFNAKLGGRKYREPASFEQAVTDLVASAGTQLDPRAVQALLDWFRIKQGDPNRLGRALGPCWAMRCSPASICKQCVAYNRSDKNCWEFEGVNCTAHGNNCSTCFIRSEALFRGQKMPSIMC